MSQHTTQDIVRFTAAQWPEDEPPHPSPANKTVPDWFSNLSQNADGIPSLRHSTVKLCMPFNDALSLGWVIRAPVDYELTKTPTGIDVTTTADDAAEPPVTPLSPDQPVREGNSAFKTPDCLLRTGWGIETPPGASLLMVPPMNRPPSPFTAMSLFINTDEYTDEILLPIVMNQDSVTIDAGTPLAQLIPIRRDTLLDSPDLRGFTSDSLVQQIEDRIETATQARASVYREDVWVNKPSCVTITDSENIDAVTTRTPAGGTGETHVNTPDRDGSDNPAVVNEHRELIGEGTDQVFYCKEAFHGRAPEPVSSEVHIPDGYRDELTGTGDINAEQPTTDWILNAMHLGQIIPLPISIDVRRDESGSLNADGHGGNHHFHVLDARKLGDKHPMAPMTPVNMITHWRPVLPRGYSNLYITPLNHHQRVYSAFSGIVESDRYLSTVNIPGPINPRYSEYTLPEGMPVTQAIPLHRDSIINVGYITNAE